MEQRVWLINLRKKNKLTQLEVANKSNIGRAYYTQIENGVRNPSVNVAKNIASSLNFDWSLFFENECSEKRQQNKEVS